MTTQSSGAVSPFGSGGVTFVEDGSAYTTALTDSFVAWKSATASAKTTTLTTPIASGVLHIKDVQGTAGTYNITLVPASGTIDGQSSYVMNANYQSISLKWDGISNWMVF